MRIGRMDKRIVLQKPVTQEDDYGGLETVYENAGKVWAMLLRTNYGEKQEEGTAVNEERFRMKIRPRKDICRGWRIVLDGEVFEVETADNTYRDNTMLIVRHLETGV